jgi:signal transduction histidine kinase
MARELHDIVSHSLSVVVAQAAGSRAQGETDPATLEKIESSGREALVEMRRLLGVLRDREDARPDLEPQPGLADLPQLVERVRAAGVPVELSIPPDHRNLSPAIELAAYRIVQEALTNTLRHAGPAQARVVVSRGPGVLLIDVTDDGQASRGTTQRQGHGLVGMIERVALFGGELRTGPGAGGGFAVHAQLPTGEVAP